MATTLDLEGDPLNIKASPATGISVEVQITLDGVPRSLVGSTVYAYVANKEPDSYAEYEQTHMIDAAIGNFILEIPPDAFTDLWGQKVTWGLFAKYASDNLPTPFKSGAIQLTGKK